jgi:hypothetical protein
MSNRRIYFLIALSLMMMLGCATILPSIEQISTSFPEILLGQVALDRQTKPRASGAYQSAELVLNLVSPGEIEQATYIQLREDVLFWEPDYIGFARTSLSADEIQSLQQWLATGHLFYRPPEGDSVQCVSRDPMKRPVLAACPPGRSFQDEFTSLKWEAEQAQAVGVLQFSLSGGRMAEMRVYPSRSGLAYTPYEISGEWWLNGVTAPLPLLEALAARAAIPSIQALWPELSAEQANRRAARLIGDRYRPALEIVQKSPAVREVFGEIQEIRPAAGSNWLSSWMDSTSIFLSFRVVGARGQGAVIVQGYDCFDLQMVFKGQALEVGPTPECVIVPPLVGFVSPVLRVGVEFMAAQGGS